MLIDDQSETVAALSSPKAYGKLFGKVDVVDTNICRVFLFGDKAYKLKKGVKYPYVDYSTPERRCFSCRREMTMCERFAPGMCIGVDTVVRDKKGRLTIGSVCRDGAVETVDYVLVMDRFADGDFLDEQIQKGTADRFEIMDLAERIWALHADAPAFYNVDGELIIRRRIDENNALIRCFTDIFDVKDVDALNAAQLKTLNEQKKLLNQRRDEHHVRLCHGDMRLHNIVMRDGKILLFNPIEFYDDLTHIDVLYDLAYLLMDMSHRGLKRLASILFNHYMLCSGDWDGFPVLPLFMSCRAGVECYVAAQMAADTTDPERKKTFADAARAYLVSAREYLDPPPPRLVACGGLSGSGKSRIAREIAPFVTVPPGAVVLRDDVFRRELKRVPPDETLGEESFLASDESQVYALMFEKAEKIIRYGHTVILDALFFKPEYRDGARRLAEKLGVEFYGFWVDAPLDVRAERVAKRKRNPSDVKSIETLKNQLNIRVGDIDWHRIDSSQDRSFTINQVMDVLK